jgi:5-methylcytosine-specific restriction protein A
MKKKIAARDHWRCRICKRLVSHTFEIDHIVPQSQGGSHEESNLRTLCRECHGVVTAEQRLK